MNIKPEVVFKTTLGNLICQIIKSGDGYVRQQTFPSGHTFEEDYNEEQYQEFLARMTAFEAFTTRPNEVEKGIKPTE